MTLWVMGAELWTITPPPWTTGAPQLIAGSDSGRHTQSRWMAICPATSPKTGLSTIHITYYYSSKNYIPLLERTLCEVPLRARHPRRGTHHCQPSRHRSWLRHGDVVGCAPGDRGEPTHRGRHRLGPDTARRSGGHRP